MKAIIIDDEPKAIDLIKEYLSHFPEIELTGTFRDPASAFQFLRKNPTELLFLDINLPEISGVAFAKMLKPETKIIFITAYAEYAMESYDVSTVDYLLKPVSFERFKKSINKVMKGKHKLDLPVLMLKSSGNIHPVPANEVLYLEKEGNYIQYYLKNRKVMVRETTIEAMGVLPDYFLQVHKSYIINKNRVDYFNKEEVSISGKVIPVGTTYKDGFLQAMNKH